MSFNPYSYGMRKRIAEEMLKGNSPEQVFENLAPLVQAGINPFVFEENGVRVPVYPNGYRKLFYAFPDVRKKIEEMGGSHLLYPLSYAEKERMRSHNYRRNVIDRFHAGNPRTIDEPVVNEPVIEPVINEPVIEPVITSPVDSLRAKFEYFERKFYALRNFVRSREMGGQKLDFISTRTLATAKRGIMAGISPDTLLHSATLTWNENTRSDAGIKAVNPTEMFPVNDPNYHEALGYVIRLVLAKIPVYLKGDPGSGKSVLANQVSQVMAEKYGWHKGGINFKELHYGEISLSDGVTKTDICGSETRRGFVGRPFSEIYEKGGVFCLEELDAANPNILLTINNAIANDHFFNPVDGKTYKKHADFVVIATANTWGTGGVKGFENRRKLDDSTLDRFRCGRVIVDYDVNVERNILWGNYDADEVSSQEMLAEIDKVFSDI